MMAGHKPGCRCVGCDPQTRKRGMQALSTHQERKRWLGLKAPRTKLERALDRRKNPPRSVFEEVHAAAVHFAKRELAGGGGDPLPADTSRRAVEWIGRNEGPFRQMVARIRTKLVQASGARHVVPGGFWTKGRNPRRSLSPKASAFIARHVSRHVREYGMPPAQAVRVAYAEAADKGYKVPAPPNPPFVQYDRRAWLNATELLTWFERDRQHVELRDRRTGRTILEWWDEDVSEAVEDGFLDPHDWHGSAVDYALSIGALGRRRKKNPLTRHETAQVVRGARRLKRLAAREGDPYADGIGEGYMLVARRFGQAATLDPKTRRRTGRRVLMQRHPQFAVIQNSLPARFAWFYVSRDGRRAEILHRKSLPAPAKAARLFVTLIGPFETAVDAVRAARAGGFTVSAWPEVNPLTRHETAEAMQDARVHARIARAFKPLSYPKGYHLGTADTFRHVAFAWGHARRSPPPRRGMPNPPRVLGVIPGRMTQIRYARTGRYRGPYYHRFGPNVRAFRLADGSVLLKGPRPLWVRD